MADDNKTLIASSEFDPAAFIAGIDAMTASLEKLSAQEDELRADMAATNATLKANRTELKQTEDQIKALDKTSKTYTDDLAKLRTQQAALKTQNKEMTDSMKAQKVALGEINTSAIKYKESISQISAISKQVANENKGRTLFDVASLNKQVQDVVKAGSNLRNVFKGKIDDKELVRLESSIAGAKDEFQALGQIIDFIKPKLATLDPDSQEFADLTQVVETGEQVLEQYGNVVAETDKKSVSMRTQLKLLREELARLEDQGKENTEEFQNLAIEAGKLDDQISDTQQRIKVLSSDTKNLDFGIGAIRGVASAFGVAEGAAALFGIKNEDVMESIQRLNAIMLILNGLQEIQNLLQKQSVVAIVGQSIATKAAAAAQGIFAAVVGISTGAMRAFRIALLATGIGAFVVLLGVLTEGFGLFSDETETAITTTDQLTESIKRQDKAMADLNNTIDFNSKIRIENLKQSGATDEQLFQEGVKTRQAQLKNFQDGLKDAQERQRIFDEERVIRARETQGDISDEEREQANTSRKLLKEDIENRQAQIKNQEQEITLFQEQQETTRFEARGRANNVSLDLYRAYLERLNELQRQLRDKTLAASPQDEENIRQQFANSLSDLSEDIDAEIASGKLSKQRGKVLKNLITQINKVDLDKELAEFNKRVLESQQQFEDKLTDLKLLNAQQRAELLRDQFLREAELVAADARNAEEALVREREDIIRGINQTRDQGLISPAAAQENVDRITLIYSHLLDNLAEQTTRKQEEISTRLFDAAREEFQRTFANYQVALSEATTTEILAITQRYKDGSITYEKYQQELSRIAREETAKRIKLSIIENEATLAAIKNRLAAEQDPAQRKALEDQITQLRATITALKREEAGADAANEQSETEGRNRRLEEIGKYAAAIGNIVGQVVQFWAAANEAEQRSLDRSIALQERRVDAATRIAERGNAEYLRLEEDRLNELQIKQENAARRQLAINAVLQTSQALTAFVTALAQGIATGGPLGGIAIAAAVIGLIASGYAIINSLQKNNVQTFAGGTKSVRRNGEPSGVDTVPAMLTEGEAVIPVDRNKAYAPAVAAIYDRQIPAEEMNNFVNSYRLNRRVLPRLDHDRMTDASDNVITYSGELLAATKAQGRQLEENNDLMRRMNKTLQALGINVNVDKNGLAISVLKATEQYNIDKNS